MIEQLKSLQGKVLETLAKHKKFEVIDVNERTVEIINNKGNPRTIWKREIEDSWALFKQQRRITQTEILDLNTLNSAYIAALLSRLPGVDYYIKPKTTLFIKQPG